MSSLRGDFVMRPLRSSMRHRAVHVALVVGWASSIQFAGCQLSPAHSDLVTEFSTPVTPIDAGVEERSSVQLAVAEVPFQHSGIQLVSGKTPAPKEAEAPSRLSFLKFWKKGDEKEKAAAKPPAPPPTREKTVAKPASAPAGRAIPDTPSAEAAKKQLAPESWFESELAERKPASPAAVAAKPEIRPSAPPSKPAVASPSAPVAEALNQRPLISDNSATTSESARPFPNARRTESESALISEAITASSQDPSWASADWSSNRPESRSAAQLTGASVSHPAVSPVPDESRQPAAGTLSESTNQRQQRLRVKALLSDAHSCQIRGELHSAYRSALLAERIAQEHHLQFDRSEENPSEFARNLATRLWGSGTDSQASAPQISSAIPEREQRPEPAPIDTADVKTDAVVDPFAAMAVSETPKLTTTARQAPVLESFQDGFATWTPAPGTSSGFQPKPASQTPELSATNSVFPRNGSGMVPPESGGWMDAAADRSGLPMIRPAAPTTDLSQSAPHAFPREMPKPSPSSRPVHSQGEGASLSSPDTSASELRGDTAHGGVQFAIAQNLSNVSEPRRFDSDVPSFLNDSVPATLSAATLDQQRPKLMAPPVPEMVLQTAASGADGMDAAATAAFAAGGDEAAPQKSGGRIVWIVIGLLGAGMATVLGLKYARRDPEGQEEFDFPSQLAETPATEDVTQESAEEDQSMSLKMNRAA